MKFSEIPGKATIKQQLRTQVEKNRIPHAQIFLGKEGAGGLPMALAFASYLMCENKTNGDSCGECNQCNKTAKFIHPDVHFAFPVIKVANKERKDTFSDDFLRPWREILLTSPFMSANVWSTHIGVETTNPNINVKECNAIIQKLNMMSYESEFKILILWLPEFLGMEGNRLLKLIEEPTDNTYIILVSENQEAILQTILSRCQVVKIPAFENEEISTYLSQKFQLESTRSQQIANLADGNLNLALNISNNQAADYSDMLISWLRVAFKSDPIDMNKWIAGIASMNKDEQKNFFEYGLHFFRQFVFKQLTQSNDVQLTAKELEIATKMASIINVPKSEAISDLLELAIESINRNINLKIMLFADTLTIGDIMRSKDL